MPSWSRALTSAIFVLSGLGVGFVGVGCTASAKVTRTTPVANLKSYKVVGVRAKGGYNLSRVLAASTIAQLSRRCQFTNVELSNYSQSKPDLILDLKIHRSWRGGSGIIQSRNKATVDVLMVLSDGLDSELLGSAWIRGESAAVALNINNRPQAPEEDALGAVAKKVASILSKSGCRGPRVARAPDPPPTTIAKNTSNTGGGNNGGGNNGGGNNGGGNNGGGNTDGGNNGGGNNGGGNNGGGNNGGGNTDGGNNGGGNTTTAGNQTGDTEAKARGEALNKEGKQLFIGANIAGAVSKFEAAAAAYPDPRFDFNICLGYETLKQYSKALAVCQRVLTKNPSAKLRGKTEKRLKIIADLRKKSK